MKKQFGMLIGFILVFNTNFSNAQTCEAYFTYSNLGNGLIEFSCDYSSSNYNIYRVELKTGDGNQYFLDSSLNNYSNVIQTHQYTFNGNFNAELKVYSYDHFSGESCNNYHSEIISITGLANPTLICNLNFIGINRCDGSIGFQVYDNVENGSTSVVKSYSWTVDGNVFSTSKEPIYNGSRDFHDFCVTLTAYDDPNQGGTGESCSTTICKNYFISDSNLITVNVPQITHIDHGLGEIEMICNIDINPLLADIGVFHYWYFIGQNNFYYVNNYDANPRLFLPNGNYNIDYHVYVTDSVSGGCLLFTQNLYYNFSVTNSSINHCIARYYIDRDSLNSTILIGTNNSYGANLSYLWDFGDGNTSTNPYPTHTYSTPGSYNVCLTINDINANGDIICTDSYCNNVYFKNSSVWQLIINPPIINKLKINNNLTTNDLKIYPNPFKDEIKVDSDKEIESYKINDVYGNEIINGLDDSNLKQLNTNTLKSGVYSLSIKFKDGLIVTKKVTKID
jgi:hypothetical protein